MNGDVMMRDVVREVQELVADMLLHSDKCPASRAGLDERCGMLIFGDDYIAVSKENDRLLQYYGGFEYVGDKYRAELGDVVFYSTEHHRVCEHHAQWADVCVGACGACASHRP